MECRGVDTFSRLANSSAASAPTPAPCSTRRDCREALLAETIVPPIATPRHAHSSRAAAHASSRRTGSAFPVHRRDGLGQCERVRVGCPLRSSKRGYRVCVVRGGAIATYVGDKKNAQKTLTAFRSDWTVDTQVQCSRICDGCVSRVTWERASGEAFFYDPDGYDMPRPP